MLFSKFKKESVYDYLIVGLGNPGLQYEQTRHNAGFMVIDRFLESEGMTSSKAKFHALIFDGTIKDKRILVAKPQTYMNSSGQSVSEIADFYHIPSEKIIVVYDDISLSPGKLRIRTKGSAGGHNGIKDIIALLGNENFPRIKVGVGEKPHPDYDLKDWVLGKFSADDRKAFDAAACRAKDALREIIITDSFVGVMNKYNG